MKKTELKRLKAVIESDRLSMTNENISLILKDVSSVLGDYFTLSGEPEMKISTKNGEYIVILTAKATAIKAFSVLDV